MEKINNLLIILFKIYILLLGVGLLIGGGGCFITGTVTAFLDPKQFVLAMVSSILLLGSIIFIKQTQYLLLLICGSFLIGTGLCASSSIHDSLSMIAILLISFAGAVSGYLMIRWLFKKRPNLTP